MWILLSAMLNMPLEDKIELIRSNSDTIEVTQPEQKKPHYNTVYVVYHNQYNDLYRKCGYNKCCKMSIRHMRHAMGEPTTNKKGCRDGSEPKSVWCPGSLLWCDPTYPKASAE